MYITFKLYVFNTSNAENELWPRGSEMKVFEDYSEKWVIYAGWFAYEFPVRLVELTPSASLR